MAVNLAAPGELLQVSGVTLGSAVAQVKVAAGAPNEPALDSVTASPSLTPSPNELPAELRDDVAVIALVAGSTVAGVFTQSGFSAPPVQLCRERLGPNASVRAFIVNSGNANAATGERGMADARALCDAVAAKLAIQGEQVLPFSTGVIGEFLPVARMVAGFEGCVENLTDDHWLAAASAIMTTDTLPKATSRQTQVGGATVTLTGMAKGAGMMRPDMATMLAFMACDATVEQRCLQSLVREVADASFNRLTVDGDTSTNDSFVLACTGQSAATAIVDCADPAYAELRAMLVDAAVELGQAIVRDGEGATKFVTVQVNGGRTQRECADVAFTVAHSPLVKTAIFAGDPNWGRFCMAIGRAGLRGFEQSSVDLHLDNVCIARSGLVADDYAEAAAAAVMARDEYLVRIELGRGQASDEVWTSDLSYEYVRVNAEYRT